MEKRVWGTPQKVRVSRHARCLLTFPHRSSVRVRRMLRHPVFAHTRRIRRLCSGGIKTEVLEKKNCSKSPERDPLQFLNVYVQVHCSRETAALQWLNENYWEVYSTFTLVELEQGIYWGNYAYRSFLRRNRSLGSGRLFCCAEKFIC